MMNNECARKWLPSINARCIRGGASKCLQYWCQIDAVFMLLAPNSFTYTNMHVPPFNKLSYNCRKKNHQMKIKMKEFTNRQVESYYWALSKIMVVNYYSTGIISFLMLVVWSAFQLISWDERNFVAFRRSHVIHVSFYLEMERDWDTLLVSYLIFMRCETVKKTEWHMHGISPYAIHLSFKIFRREFLKIIANRFESFPMKYFSWTFSQFMTPTRLN